MIGTCDNHNYTNRIIELSSFILQQPLLGTMSKDIEPVLAW